MSPELDKKVGPTSTAGQVRQPGSQYRIHTTTVENDAGGSKRLTR